VPNILFIATTLWEVDEKERAAKQYLRYITLREKDQKLNSFKNKALPIIEKYGAIITARGEFKKAWEEIADLAYDSPEDRQAYKDLPQANWPSRQRKDIIGALAKIRELRQLMAKNKAVVAPGQYKQIEEAVDAFNDLLNIAANQTMAESRLAAFYRESDQFEKALPILTKHYEDDPLSLENQMAVVLVTHNAALKADPMPPKAELEKARSVAANIRTEKRGTRDKIGYWEAYTLVLEFSVMMGETKVVNDSLSFLRRDRSDLTRDLVAPPVYGDDKRVRRPQNALSIQLAKRFFDLYQKEKEGITEKPPFAIIEIDNNGTPMTIFAEPEAPAFETKTMLTPDEDEVIAIVATDGSTPAPKVPTAAAPPAPAIAVPATPAPVDAAPKTEEKPADAKKGDQ
jgi:tetratricopeptide (TPR) repeat protein